MNAINLSYGNNITLNSNIFNVGGIKALNGTGEQFASVFNQEYYYSFNYDLFQPNSYAVNMSGYSSPNLCSEELFNFTI